MRKLILVAGGLIVAFYVLGGLVKREGPAPVASPSSPPIPNAEQVARQRKQDDERFDLYDLIPGTIGNLHLYAASVGPMQLERPYRNLAGLYRLSIPGRAEVDRRFPEVPDSQYAELSCFGGPKAEASCSGKGAQSFVIDGNKVCAEPDQRVPAGYRNARDAWTATAGWAGHGDCHLIFARGIVGKELTLEAAAGMAAQVAEWMKPILAGTAEPGSLEGNRKVLAGAMRRWGEMSK